MNHKSDLGRARRKHLDWIFKGFIGVIFPPPKVAPKLLSPIAKTLIALGFIAPIVLAAPPIKDVLFCHLFKTPSLEDKDIIKNYCDYFAICFQILIAITIGGIAITESAVQIIRSKVSAMQASQVAQADKWQRGSIKRFIKIYRDIRYAGKDITVDNMFIRAKNIVSDILALFFSIFGSRSYIFYAMLISLRVGVVFPGGLYGVFAFTLFEGLIISQVVKTYLDYAPVCP
jgi:hypothetical protein